MKDLTMPEAEERMTQLLPHSTFSILYQFNRFAFDCGDREREHRYQIATHTPQCELFSAPTLRGAVEKAEQFHGHHVVPDLEAVQEQFAGMNQ